MIDLSRLAFVNPSLAKLGLSTLFTLSATLFSTQIFAEIKTFDPQFPQFSENAIERKKSNRFYSLGDATFSHGIKIPAYGVTVQNPMDDGLLKDSEPCTKKTCNFNFTLKAQDATQLKLIELPSIGYVLIPRHWTDISAGTGANGTGSALIMSPNQKEAITLYNSSVCAGCGYPNASLYFPQLLKQSVEYEYGGVQDRNKKLTLVYPLKTTAFFSYQIPNISGKTHGVAKYIDDGDFNFVNIHLTLEQQNRHLATPILNFYNATH